MSSYIVKSPITITRQEGDNSDLEIKIPVELDITNADIKFQVSDQYGRAIIEKDLASGITKTGQDIAIELLPDDTKGYSGTQQWELQLDDQLSYKIVTVGKGKFIIEKEIII